MPKKRKPKTLPPEIWNTSIFIIYIEKLKILEKRLAAAVEKSEREAVQATFYLGWFKGSIKSLDGKIKRLEAAIKKLEKAKCLSRHDSLDAQFDYAMRRNLKKKK